METDTKKVMGIVETRDAGVFTLPWIVTQVKKTPVKQAVFTMLIFISFAAVSVMMLLFSVTGDAGANSQALFAANTFSYDPEKLPKVVIEPAIPEGSTAESVLARNQVIADLGQGHPVSPESATALDQLQWASPAQIVERAEQQMAQTAEVAPMVSNPVIPQPSSEVPKIGGLIYMREYLDDFENISRIQIHLEVSIDGQWHHLSQLVATFPDLSDGHGNMHNRLWGITSDNKVVFLGLLRFTQFFDDGMHPIQNPMNPTPFQEETTTILGRLNGNVPVASIAITSVGTYAKASTIYHEGPDFEVPWNHHAARIGFR